MKYNNDLYNSKELFIKYAKIYSPSGKESEIRKKIIDDLKNIGVEVFQDEYGNLIKTSSFESPILFTAHMDTVEPSKDVEILERDGFLISNGKTIVGGDNKAGLTSIISGLAKAKLEGKNLENVELLITVEEEAGLKGIQNTDLSVFRSRKGISFDKSGGNFGELILELGIYGFNIDLKIFGKAAHAGKPEQGINAVNIFLEAFSSLRLGRIDSETTFNLGVISSGDASNTVPGNLFAKGDIRGFNLKTIEALKDKIEKNLNESIGKYGGKFEITFTQVVPGFQIDTGSDFCKSCIRSVGELSKIKTKFIQSFGGVESSYLNNFGIETLTISCGVFGEHTTEEKVDIQSLEMASDFVNKLI